MRVFLRLQEINGCQIQYIKLAHFFITWKFTGAIRRSRQTVLQNKWTLVQFKSTPPGGCSSMDKVLSSKQPDADPGAGGGLSLTSSFEYILS